MSEQKQKAIALIMRKLPADGSMIGNLTMLRLFEEEGLTSELYNDVKAKLINDGRIETRRGTGGAIARKGVTLRPDSTKPTRRIAMAKSTLKPTLLDDNPSNDVKVMILGMVPSNGSSVGNMALIKKLARKKIPPDSYWASRNELIQEGKLIKGRGQGGSVSLPEKPQAKRTDPDFRKKYKKERDLYLPFDRTVRDYWIKDNNIEAKRCIVQITADQGGKKTGGKWTRPDISIVAVNTFRFVPGKSLDVITFEIKPANDLDIIGVFETASHSRFAAKSYLAVHLPSGKTQDLEPQIEVLTKECERFGIGFMYFEDPDDPGTWETIVEPTRKTPDPAEVDNFLSIQISKRNQDELQYML